MASVPTTNTAHGAVDMEKSIHNDNHHHENGVLAHDHQPATSSATATTGVMAGGHHHHAGAAQRKPYDYGGNPLARLETHESARFPAFGGEFQPGAYRPPTNRKIANPAPLGLFSFALTTFLLSCINTGARGLTKPNIVVGAAFAYGGLVQLIAGIFEMITNNVFGATALSSYGGFWIGTAIILTPGFQIETLEGTEFANAFGLYLMAWFIVTFLFLLLTLRSTVAFFSLFFFLDLAFLMLGIGYLKGGESALIRAGGVFGFLAAFLAWYNGMAGMADKSNFFAAVPVMHFPWSEKGREARGKVDNSAEREAQFV